MIKVLLVEDVLIAQKMALLTLLPLQCEVDVAETGNQSLELVESKVYDIIFMDIGLPDMDGLTVTENIRKMEKTIGRIPIIGLTAHSEDNIRESCLRLGMDDFLVKPLTMEGAQRVLAKFVKPLP